MSKRMVKLVEFIDKYGEDYLQDGTKNRIIKSLENGDIKLALDILDSVDDDWLKRTKEIEKFLIFSDWQNISGDTQPFFRANYMDLQSMEKIHIPTLRRVIPRNLEMDENLDGWEIE